MFFHGVNHEKVMSLNFFQLRFENIKVMADAKKSGQLHSGFSDSSTP
jgi:hypothetical protein